MRTAVLALALLTLALVSGGCGGNSSAAEAPASPTVADTTPDVDEEVPDPAPTDVEASLADYFQSHGLSVEVMEDGCADGMFEQDGLHLYECVVYPGGGPDAETWNVAVSVEDGLVVDASAK